MDSNLIVTNNINIYVYTKSIITMKLKIIIISTSFLILSCKNDKQNYSKKDDLFLLQKYAVSYEPNKINSLDDDSLKHFNVKYIFSLKEKQQEDVKNEVANILLLKQYLLHLKKANQSYNLKDFDTKEAKIIIEYFLAKNKIDSSSEFLSSSIPYEFLKGQKNITSKEVKKLIEKINKEENRINVYTDSINR
ncbi:hypothetical protein D3C87_395390 [compost metagenome]